MEPRVERALRELSGVLAESDVVARARKAREDVQGREAARIMLRDLENLQGEILRRAGQGEQVPQELESRYRQVAEYASYNPYVRELLQAESELAQTLDEIQRELLRAAGLTPPAEEQGETPSRPEPGAPSSREGTPAEPGQAQEPQGPKVDAVRSKLWVPGQGRP
ncbi:YlbF family regulator [Limnochorda pilosa]|uniref:YlbF family regulator n=1 Tax=Limnochorda pilosa TaxID=1555112 RepID=A0A0K2SGA5_LIMPI|nr:YlbF family regulator [Limnochorda pilosa]BAS25869.1 hypothetical protein LIP_0009 [Limnochorda pilosa]